MKKSPTAELNRSSNQAAKENSDIHGYVERIEHTRIEGWAFSLAKKNIQLAIGLGDGTHTVTPIWHERSDVANQFGKDYLRCGFNIEIPEELTEAYLDACRDQQAINILVDGTPLASRINPTDFKAVALASQLPANNKSAPAPLKREFANIPSKLLPELPDNMSEELLAYLSNTFFKNLPQEVLQSLSAANTATDSARELPLDVFENAFEGLADGLADEMTAFLNQSPLFRAVVIQKDKLEKIVGYVEAIDLIKASGWVIRTDLKAFAMSVKIGENTYPVEPVWVSRSDVAAKYGSEFIDSGFEIFVPEEAIDEFLDAQLQPKSLDILADGVTLKQSFKPKKPAAEDDAVEETEPVNLRYKDIQQLNAGFGVEVTSQDFFKLLSRQMAYPVRVSEDDTVNAQFYFESAKTNLMQQRREEGRSLLKACLAFDKRTEYWELLANTYLDQGDYETADRHYQAALASPGRASKWLHSNLHRCKKHLSRPKQLVQTLLDGIEHMPDVGLYRERFDEAMQEYWLKQQGTLEVLAVNNDRHGLVAKMTQVSSFIYNAYLRFYGVKENPRWLNSCNLERVLIVGDFHIPQCVRYRIEQKIEQLKAAGKDVATLSWTELGGQQNTLAFYDTVIFYRVPAEVQVLKAMAQVNAAGKLSIYEIDDLLFDPAYPPAIETYGGYLDLNVYLQILKGMGSFNAAARCCRFGLASTRPLAEQLQGLVFGGHCYIHRNGLDSLNVLKPKSPDPEKQTLDIFYGSGTMAHNSDFIDLVLPALARILEQYPQARLIVAGYLRLPSPFKKRFAGQIKTIPPVNNVKVYWSMLEQADINLAVLHDDLVNGCKSELKWFEAACLGIPSVMSGTANYRDVVREGEDGLLAVTADDWYENIKWLLDRPECRQQLAEAAQQRVLEEYSVPHLAKNITNVLANAVTLAQPENLPPRRKLALVNVFFPPQAIGGATRVIADNFEHLRDEYADQFEISVFTSQADHKPPHQMDTYNYQGVRVYRTTIQWREHMDWHGYDEQVGKLFAEYLAAEKPDLIHFHCIQRLTGAIVEAAIKAEIPYLVTVHDAWWISDYQFLVDTKNKVYPDGHPDIFEKRTLPANISLESSIERLFYLKDLLRQAEKILTVSNRFAEIYRKNGITQIKVNKNGISETTDWQPKNTRNKTKVVCGHIGGMAEHKGYFLLKEAINALQPQNIELLVVDHSHDEGYRHQVLWGKVPVTFIGRVRQEHIVDLYRQIDVLFAPSKWPESYGLVTREAAACRCWVVASNLGGIGEDVIEGRSGFVIEPTHKALVACLEKIDAEPSRYKDLAQPLQLRSVKEQVKELVECYNQIGDKIDKTEQPIGNREPSFCVPALSD